MQLRFKILETVTSEVYYGSYCIYILGGHYVKTNSDFFVKVVNTETKEEIELTEKSLKAKDFKYGIKAVKFYEFQINDYGKFELSCHNYKDIVVKDSMLEVFPFPFSLVHQLHSFLLGRSRKRKNLDEIELLVE